MAAKVKTECRLEEKSLRLTYELSKQKNYNAGASLCGFMRSQLRGHLDAPGMLGSSRY